MKKTLILTSVLALAACGGGSGGGGATATTNGAAEFLRSGSVISDAAAESNSHVTSMASAIVVANDGSGNAARTARAATTRTYQGKTYTIFNLDNVNFHIAENPEQGFFNFEMEGGRINKITQHIGGSVNESNRIDEESKFEGPIFEFVKAGSDNAKIRVADDGTITKAQLDAIADAAHAQNSDIPDHTGGEWNRVEEVLDIATLGHQDSNNKLRYSDFGHFNPVYRYKNRNLTTDSEIVKARAHTLNRSADLDQHHTEQQMQDEFDTSLDYQLFAGGYAIEGTTIKDTLTPQAGTTFKGTAIGRVYSSIQTKGTEGANRRTYLDQYGIQYNVGDQVGDDTTAANYLDPTDSNFVSSNKAGHDMANVYMTNDATLEIAANGNQTLKLPFNTKSTDTSNKFYDVQLVADANNVVNSVAFTGTPTQEWLRKNDTPDAGKTEGNFAPGYYGVDTPSEAAGTTRYYTEQTLAGSGDNVATREWEVQAAWGMKKQ